MKVKNDDKIEFEIDIVYIYSEMRYIIHESDINKQQTFADLLMEKQTLLYFKNFVVSLSKLNYISSYTRDNIYNILCKIREKNNGQDRKEISSIINEIILALNNQYFDCSIDFYLNEYKKFLKRANIYDKRFMKDIKLYPEIFLEFVQDIKSFYDLISKIIYSHLLDKSENSLYQIADNLEDLDDYILCCNYLENDYNIITKLPLFIERREKLVSEFNNKVNKIK